MLMEHSAAGPEGIVHGCAIPHKCMETSIFRVGLLQSARLNKLISGIG